MKTAGNNINIRSITIHDKAAYQQVYDLREEILRKPIGLSLKNEDLSGDADDIIIIAEIDGTVVGCVMIHPTAEAGVMKLRQMAIAEGLQGTGIGRMIVKEAEQVIKKVGNTTIKLHARITAEGFYQRLNYITTSAVFTEVGIPHVIMEKELV